MKRLLYCAVATLMACTTPENDLTQYVNPLIGTDFTGNTYPGAQVPFGMVQLSPDNGLPGWDRIAGYFYPDSTIAGFSHTHLQGTGAGDLYDISFMPVVKPWREAEAPLGIHSRFSHEEETAEAGYYQVRLSDYGINVELTATPRVGVQQYTFPTGDAAVFLNLAKAMNWDATRDSEIRIVDSATICGYRYSSGWAQQQCVYFATQFSRPFEHVQLDTVGIFDDNQQRIGKGCVARFDFTTIEGEKIVLKTAISGVSEEGAFQNLTAEAPHFDFDKYRGQAKQLWQNELTKVEVQGGTADERTCFYTALYHAFTAPTLFSDVDSAYLGADRVVHRNATFENYSTFSLWDTYRAAHPLYTILQQRRTNDMAKSLLAHGTEAGRLPVWSFYGNETDMMIGYHAVPVVVDAYLKGLGDFSAHDALDACVTTANVDHYRGIGLYKKLGFVPYDVVDEYNSENWSLSRTLEYAFDDYCIALLAERLGEDSLKNVFLSRSENYKNVYNPATTFMQPRNSQGEFQPDFSPDEYTSHICESNAWHYFWSVQHDVEGLIQLVGREKFTEKLDSLFSYNPSSNDALPIFSTGMIGQYAHGNEPSHHVAYLYNAVHEPWKTKQLVLQIMREFYTNTPAGLCGNEDCGQMSAWYVFSALGFYPVNPVSGRYELGCPLFDSTTLHLENGNTFTIRVTNRSATNCYVQRVLLDGKDLKQSFITHEQLMNGGDLEFVMSTTPACWY